MNTAVSKQTPAVVAVQQLSSQPGWYPAETLTELEASSIISPWIRNRTLHCLQKINLFFFLGNYHTFYPLAGRNNFKMGNILFFQYSAQERTFNSCPFNFSFCPFMRRSWVHSKQMPEHRPLHQHCRKFLGSLALSDTSTANSMDQEEMQTLKF